MKAKRTLFAAMIVSSLMLTSTAFASETSTTQKMSAKEGTNLIANYFLSDQINQAKMNGSEWLLRTDISLHVETDRKPTYSIETIQPIGKQTDRITNFTQFRIGNDLSAGTVANLGFGRRVLAQDKTSMTGVNVFYDYGFKHGHARIGGGLEYFQGRNEYRANVYHAISGEKEVDTTLHIFERALSGYDYSMATSFSKAPWAKVGVTGFHWDYKNSEDSNGYKLFTQVQVTPRVHLELGYWDDNKGPGENYAKVMYSIGNRVPAMFEEGKPVFRSVNEKVTVESKRLDKVQRENDIKVETVSKAGGVTISIGRN